MTEKDNSEEVFYFVDAMIVERVLRKISIDKVGTKFPDFGIYIAFDRMRLCLFGFV